MPASPAKRDQNSPDEILAGVLQQIEEHGSLLRFAPQRAVRLELMKALSKRGLVAWNKEAGRYQLTTLGYDALNQYRKEAASGRRAAVA